MAQPAAVQQLGLLLLSDGVDDVLEGLARLGIEDAEVDALADLAVEVGLEGTTGQDVLAVNDLDDHAGRDLALAMCQRPRVEHLEDA